MAAAQSAETDIRFSPEVLNNDVDESGCELGNFIVCNVVDPTTLCASYYSSNLDVS